MKINRLAPLVGVLAAMAGAFWAIPVVSDSLFGTEGAPQFPFLAVATVLIVVAVVGVLARKIPWWATGACCALAGAVVLLLWPYPDSDFAWVVAWLVTSGALAVSVLGGFAFGALASHRSERVS